MAPVHFVTFRSSVAPLLQLDWLEYLNQNQCLYWPTSLNPWISKVPQQRRRVRHFLRSNQRPEKPLWNALVPAGTKVFADAYIPQQHDDEHHYCWGYLLAIGSADRMAGHYYTIHQH
jgi:hypothetical protein